MTSPVDQQFCGMRFDDFSAVLWRRWPKNNLTMSYFDDRLQAGASMAASKWSAVSGLEIDLLSGGDDTADLKLSFQTGDHGDGAPFFGAGGALAHGFYPSYAYDFRLEGQAHFDTAERWAFALGDVGFRMDVVSLHEVGHNLGLGHNEDDPLSVMYPRYRGVETLSRDDIAGIQKLYGPPPTPPPVPGDEFHWHHERTEGWNYEIKYLFNAMLAGKVYGTTYTNFRGRTVPQVLVDAPWEPD